MKKSLFIILMVCLAVVGLVSCKNEVEPAQEELIYVSFEKGSSRALTATLEDFDVDDFYWSYEAQKNDGSGLRSGQTVWNDTGVGSVAVQTGKGLDDSNDDPVKVPGFSKGYWDFRLFGYTDAARTKLAYWGEADSVLIDNNHHMAEVTVSPVSGADGYLRIGTITFVPASGISVPTDLVIYTDQLFKLEGTQWVLVNVQPVDGVYTLPAKQYKFTRTYSFDGIPVANGSVIATVYSNLTTTISGTLSELTTYAEFGAEQNPDIVRETWGTTTIDEDTTGTINFAKNLDPAATEKVASATMPAEAAVAKLAELEEVVGADDDSSSTLKLNLSVDTTDVRQQSVTYDIGMEAVLTYTKNQTQSVAKSDVKNVTKYVLIDINLTSDISDVTVTHSGEDMILTDDMSRAGEQGETDPKYVDVNKGTTDDPLWVGFYQLETTSTGKVLHLKTKSFSPFEVTYEMTNYVAAIGSVKYTTLTAAIAAAKAGDTIIILDNITTDDGYLINKDLSIDTHGYTITVNEGANINNRAFKVKDGAKLSVYGGGTIDAKGQATKSTGTDGTGCYGAFRAEIGTELYLKDITLKNYRPWGLNVKVLGASAELDNVRIVSVCGGGIEVTDDDGAAGNVTGYAKLTDCVIEQSGWRDWCSVPVSVSGNSKVDVYSSSYTGEYGAYVFSSGGVINIYGGTFTANDDHPVLITSYDAQYGNDAVINVSGGSFTGAFEIGTDGHQFLNISGGQFTSNPSEYVVDGYYSYKDGDWYKIAPVVIPYEESGTKDDPFLLASVDDFLKMNQLSDAMMGGNDFYFKLTSDIDLRDVSFSTEYVVKYISGGFDGQKSETETYKIYAPNDSDVSCLFDCIGDVEISDLEIVLDSQSVSLAGYLWDGETFVFDNVDFSSVDFGGNVYPIEHNGSMYFSFNYRYGGSGWGGNYLLKDCDVKLNLSGASSSNSAVFVGGYAYNYGDSMITMKDCSYEGTFRGNYVALVLSNGQNYSPSINALDITGLVNKGSLIGTGGAYAVGAQNHTGECSDPSIPQYYDAVQATTGGSYSILSVAVDASVDSENKVVISNPSESYTYKVSLYAGREIYDSNGNMWASNYNYAINFGVPAKDVYRYGFVDYETAIAEELIEASDCDPEGWKSADCELPGSGVYQIVDKGSAKYYVLKFTTDDNLYSRFVIELQTPTVMVCAYDSSNNLVGLKEF